MQIPRTRAVRQLTTPGAGLSELGRHLEALPTDALTVQSLRDAVDTFSRAGGTVSAQEERKLATLFSLLGAPSAGESKGVEPGTEETQASRLQALIASARAPKRSARAARPHPARRGFTTPGSFSTAAGMAPLGSLDAWSTRTGEGSLAASAFLPVHPDGRSVFSFDRKTGTPLRLDTATGEVVRFEALPPGGSWPQPVLSHDGETLYVATGGSPSSLHAFDVETGTQRWRASARGANAAVPHPAEDAVFVSHDTGAALLEGPTGLPRWSYTDAEAAKHRGLYRPRLSSDASLLAVVERPSSKPRLHLLETDSGALVWDAPLPLEGDFLDTLAFTGQDELLLYSVFADPHTKQPARLFALDVATREVRWELSADRHPANARMSHFVSTVDGARLRARDLRRRRAGALPGPEDGRRAASAGDAGGCLRRAARARRRRAPALRGVE